MAFKHNWRHNDDFSSPCYSNSTPQEHEIWSIRLHSSWPRAASAGTPLRTRLDGERRCCEAAPVTKVSAPDAPAPSLLLLVCRFFPLRRWKGEEPAECRVSRLPLPVCWPERAARSVGRMAGLCARCVHWRVQKTGAKGARKKLLLTGPFKVLSAWVLASLF